MDVRFGWQNLTMFGIRCFGISLGYLFGCFLSVFLFGLALFLAEDAALEELGGNCMRVFRTVVHEPFRVGASNLSIRGVSFFEK